MAKDSGSDRPEYMEVLGLSPPYAMEDVKKAYLDRVMQVHPDHGGSREDFAKLQEAFDLAELVQSARARVNKRMHFSVTEDVKRCEVALRSLALAPGAQLLR